MYFLWLCGNLLFVFCTSTVLDLLKVNTSPLQIFVYVNQSLLTQYSGKIQFNKTEKENRRISNFHSQLTIYSWYRPQERDQRLCDCTLHLRFVSDPRQSERKSQQALCVVFNTALIDMCLYVSCAPSLYTLINIWGFQGPRYTPAAHV